MSGGLKQRRPRLERTSEKHASGVAACRERPFSTNGWSGTQQLVGNATMPGPEKQNPLEPLACASCSFAGAPTGWRGPDPGPAAFQKQPPPVVGTGLDTPTPEGQLNEGKGADWSEGRGRLRHLVGRRNTKARLTGTSPAPPWHAVPVRGQIWALGIVDAFARAPRHQVLYGLRSHQKADGMNHAWMMPGRPPLS